MGVFDIDDEIITESMLKDLGFDYKPEGTYGGYHWYNEVNIRKYNQDNSCLSYFVHLEYFQSNYNGGCSMNGESVRNYLLIVDSFRDPVFQWIKIDDLMDLKIILQKYDGN